MYRKNVLPARSDPRFIRSTDSPTGWPLCRAPQNGPPSPPVTTRGRQAPRQAPPLCWLSTAAAAAGIVRAWKRSPYRIGPTKTRKSVRTINLPKDVLDKLDYSGEWLFTNPGRGRRAEGGPVRAPNFRANMWKPAVERAWPDKDADGNPTANPMWPRIHDVRHTCASWLIAAGRPLPAIQARLSHESIKTTVDRYGHLDRTSAAGNADAIGAMLKRPAP